VCVCVCVCERAGEEGEKWASKARLVTTCGTNKCINLLHLFHNWLRMSSTDSKCQKLFVTDGGVKLSSSACPWQAFSA